MNENNNIQPETTNEEVKTVEMGKVVNENKVVTSKKKSKLGYVIAIIILAIVLFGVYNVIFNDSKNIFLKAMNNEYQKADEMIDTFFGSSSIHEYDTVSTTTAMNFNVNVQDGILDEDEMAILNEINALNLLMNTQYDSINKQLYYGLDLKYDTADLFNIGVYGKTNSLYVELKNIFDKYIEIPVEEYESLFENDNTNIEDMKYVASAIKDSFLNNLDKKEFVESKETITIGSEEIKAKKITYVFTEEKAVKHVIKMLTDLKNDNKFIKACSKVSGEEVEAIKSSIQEMIDELNDELDLLENSDESIEISVYTKGFSNTAVQFSMVVNTDDKAEIRYSNYNDVKRIALVADGETVLNITNTKEEENSYKTTASAGSIKLVVNSKKENDNWNHTYRLTESESTLEVSGEVTSTMKEVTKDKEYITDMKFTALVGAEGAENIMGLEITGTTTTKIGEMESIPDVSNSVLYTNLTEEDMNTILENIMNNQSLVDFINRITSYSSIEDDYDYDNMDYSF